MADNRPPHHLAKLIRLWRLYARMDLLWLTRDFRFAMLCVISDLVLSLGGVSAVFLLAERFDGIGPWSKWHVIFMLGYATTVTGVMTAFFTFNILHISRRLGRGQLDHTLIQPQPLWVSFLSEGFMPFSGSMPLMAGLGLTFGAAIKLNLAITPAWLGLAFLQLVSSCIVLLAFSFLTGSLAFWAPRAAEEMCSLTVEMMSSLRSFPLDGVGSFLSVLLLSVLPIGFMAWQPCRSLLHLSASPLDAAVTPLAALVLAVCAACVFRKGIAHYAVTGSQRYLDHGHRR